MLPGDLLALAAVLLLLWPAYGREAMKSSSIASNATEAAALLRFKAALRDNKALASWDSPAFICTNWTGVSCSPQGQVTIL